MQPQSLKLHVGDSVIVMKFGHSTEENWERVTIFPDTHIFQTTAFVYAGEVEDAFFKPNKINIYSEVRKGGDCLWREL